VRIAPGMGAKQPHFSARNLSPDFSRHLLQLGFVDRGGWSCGHGNT
jgi:hypothetical protein